MQSGLGVRHEDGVLEQLVAPLSVEQFFSQHYEQGWFRSAGGIGLISDLLSLERIDEIISDSELPPTSLSMAQGGEPVPQGQYAFANGAVDRGAVLDLFRNGATIVLPQLHFADGNLYSFCLSLEREFGARTQTNIYLTPPGEHGFGIHYDDHDVFVLQVSGAKDWEIYGARDGLPFRGEGFRRGVDDPGELREQFVLNAGECLYVPRGTAHRALTHGDEPSLHITVGILVKTWADFMLEAVAEASLRVPGLRRALPRDLHFAPERAEEYRAHFAALLADVAETADFEAIRSAFTGNFVREQGPRTRGALLALARPIAPGTRLSVRPDIVYAFEQDEAGEHAIVLSGASLPLCENMAAQLPPLLAAGSFAKAELSGCDAEEVDDVVGTLVAYGLLLPEG